MSKKKGKTAFSALYHVVTLHYHHNEIEKDEKEEEQDIFYDVPVTAIIFLFCFPFLSILLLS